VSKGPCPDESRSSGCPCKHRIWRRNAPSWRPRRRRPPAQGLIPTATLESWTGACRATSRRSPDPGDPTPIHAGPSRGRPPPPATGAPDSQIDSNPAAAKHAHTRDPRLHEQRNSPPPSPARASPGGFLRRRRVRGEEAAARGARVGSARVAQAERRGRFFPLVVVKRVHNMVDLESSLVIYVKNASSCKGKTYSP
jgi:hypothetical protein